MKSCACTERRPPHPAYADAAGKILLAEKSDADVMRLYPEGLTAITPKTITNPSVLFESLDATRQTGVAVSNEESTMYVRSVAVPIKKHDVTCYGLEPASRSLTTPRRKSARYFMSCMSSRAG